MSKYKKALEQMVSENKELFDEFKTIHDNYIQDPNKWRAEFNKQGEQVVEIIRKYEKLLTLHSDNSSYSKFSTNLSDRFWSEVRKYFPKIDFIGVH